MTKLRRLVSPHSEARPGESRLRAFAFAVVPLVGVLELGLHAKQMTDVVPPGDYAGAKAIVTRDLKVDDLVLFAPAWNDPIGRETFGNDVMTLERSAFPDVSRYARAYEVSIRGAERPETKGWRIVQEQRSGKVTVRLRENPQPALVLSDLVSLFGPATPVSRTSSRGEQGCTWGQGRAQTGGLGYGPALPGDKASCDGGTFVGLTVLPALDYTPRRCLEASPGGEGGATRIHFPAVTFGRQIHGHHGIYVEQERNKTGAPVTVSFLHAGLTLGRATHRDGDGWSAFTVDTGTLAGTSGDLDVEVVSSDTGRKYCFEADTR